MGEPGVAAPTAALVLASASPRRRALLAELTVEVLVDPADVDEAYVAGTDPRAHVSALAAAKAAAVADRHPAAIVVAADTEVVLVGPGGGTVLGKPADRVDARAMLRRLSGRTAQVVTGLAVRLPDGRCTVEVAVSEVTVRELSDDEIAGYLATGDADDKAGALAVQGEAARFVSGIVGCYTNVVGLPLCRIARWVAPETAWECHGPAPSCDAYAARNGHRR